MNYPRELTNILILTILLLNISFISSNMLMHQEEFKSLTTNNYFLKTPTYNIHTGGRLTEDQLILIAEAGYKSLVSVVVFTTHDYRYKNINGSFPTSEEELAYVTALGLKATYQATSLTPEYAYSISSILDNMPHPTFVHCHVGWTATLFTLLHQFIIGDLSTGEDIFSVGLQYGWDYRNNSDAVSLINSVTKPSEPYTSHDQVIEQSLVAGEDSYKNYYWVHRAAQSDNWFNMGQLLSTHIDSIELEGYKVVISFREEGELSYPIHASNIDFTDADSRYNVTAERNAIQANGILKFIHLPISNDPSNQSSWTKKQFLSYLPSLIIAEQSGPVIVHCNSGYRSAAYITAYVAYKNQYCLDWALQQSLILGFNFKDSTYAYIISFMKSLLSC